MKISFCKTYLLLFFIAFSFTAYTQTDSLKKVLLIQKEDTNKVNILNELSRNFSNNEDIKSAFQYANEALLLSQKLNFKQGTAEAYYNIEWVYSSQNNFSESLKKIFDALIIWQELNDKQKIAKAYYEIARLYSALGNYSETIKYFYEALRLYETIGNKNLIAITLAALGNVYIAQNNLSEGLKNLIKASQIYKATGDERGLAECLNSIGDVLLKQKDFTGALKKYTDAQKSFEKFQDKWWDAWSYQSIGQVYEGEGSEEKDKAKHTSSLNLALKNYSEALKIFIEINDVFGITAANIAIGSLNIKLENYAKATTKLNEALQMAKKTNLKEYLKNVYEAMSKLDSAKGNFNQAYTNYKMYVIYRDSLLNEESTRKTVQSQLQYEFDKKEAITKSEQAKKDAETKRIKNQQYFAIAALGIGVLAAIIIAVIQFRNNKHKQKANLLLQDEKQKVETTLSELKSTQAQLIQSEKMASLGELTAGIAHEIQNPLNFVNNFSDVNKELLEELKDEADKANIDEVKAIANDVIDNEEKINHHGKRAAAIVKGMLQHSRKSEGVKVPSDINALCDEYLRLSYHGLRAKEKEFNADFKTDFDESIGKINIVPQDIGRVLLNLINNAFYAVNEKKKLMANSYQPTAEVKTRRINDKVEITVSDNGNGIPQNIIDKIFQPFFTTKPTGQGTGLGLSLAYDIITKEHNGTIKVESKDGESSTFIINLPVA